MKTKLYISLIASLMLLVIFISGCKKDVSTSTPKTNFKINFIPAKTNNELLDIQANSKANIVKTLAGFDAMINSYYTPFSKLSPNELQTFRDNLVFRENKGVAGLNFIVIKNKLSTEEFDEVMTYFGIDAANGYWGFSTNTKVLDDIRGGNTIPLTDYDGYKCVQRATCYEVAGNICLASC